jgi:hypothetical protein
MAQNAALANVLDQATRASENFQPPQVTTAPENLPVPANNNSSALAKPTMDSMVESGGMTVDEYLTVKAEGFRIGEMKGLIEEFIAELDMSDVVPIYSARGETSGNTKFIKSYDGARTPQGENFQVAMRHLEATSTKFVGPYQSAEIPVELVEDVKDPKSSLVIDSGTIVGITPSVTGFNHFQKFLKKLTKQDPALLTSTLKVKVIHTKRTNKNNNEWGVVDFELLGVV